MNRILAFLVFFFSLMTVAQTKEQQKLEQQKIQIQKVVEGFDMEQNGGIEEFATNIDDNHGENLYENKYHDLYRVQDGLEYGDGGSEDLAGLSNDVFHNDDNYSKSKKYR